MPNISKKTKLVALISFTLFVSALAGVAGMTFFVQRESAALTQATSERVTQELAYKEMSTIAKMVETTKSDREELESYVLTDDGVIRFLSDLESVGKKMGLTVSTTNVDTEADGKDKVFEFLKLQLSAKGSRAQLQTYVSYLEGLPYQISIDQLNLSQSGIGSAEWSLVVQVHLTKIKSAE